MLVHKKVFVHKIFFLSQKNAKSWSRRCRENFVYLFFCFLFFYFFSGKYLFFLFYLFVFLENLLFPSEILGFFRFRVPHSRFRVPDSRFGRFQIPVLGGLGSQVPDYRHWLLEARALPIYQ